MNKILPALLILTTLLISQTLAATLQTVKHDDMINEAKNYLTKQINWPQDKVEITLSNPLADTEVPAGKVSFFIPINTVSNTGPYYTIPLSILVNEQPAKTMYVNFSVRYYDDAIIAVKNLKKQETITSDKIKITRLDITKYLDQKTIYKSPEEIVGLRASQYIREGQIITGSLIEKPPLVGKKQQVQVIGKIGQISASISGLAMDSGAINEVIRVQNPATGKIFLAKVIEKNQVEVVF